MNVGMRSFYPIGVFRGATTLIVVAPMRRFAAAIAPALLLLAPAAHAAVVKTDRACYLRTPNTTVTVSGTGFTPARPYTVTLDGAPLSSATTATDANGAMQGAINPPALGAKEQERAYKVSVATDAESASTVFTVTRFLADFTPATRVTPTSRVRFSVYGFGLASPNPDVYLHYVRPDGRLRKTIRLGRAQGQCGSIRRTARRVLFPFANPRRGRWQLQFDTSNRYRKGVAGAPFLFFTIGVNVRGR